MTEPANAPQTQTKAQDGGFLAPRPGSQPVDHCFRCGVETPAGVGLCDEHNPKKLPGPSSTQMHATIFGGIVIGVIGFFFIARLAISSEGPWPTEVTGAISDGAGGVAITFSVTNDGGSGGVADCRVTRDGVPRPDDLAFRTPSVAAGETVVIDRQLEQAPDSAVPYVAGSVSVICT